MHVVYVDLERYTKSIRAIKHVEDLEECFEVLRKYRMKLNPEKCSFGVRGGKFLGFMVSQRGIEANTEKIKAILSMTTPRSVKGVQELTGRMTPLNRFISRSADKRPAILQSFKARKRIQVDGRMLASIRRLKEYISRTLHGAELRYTNIEKLALTLVVAGRKLRPYLLCHQVVVLTNHPLKQALSIPEASGRMFKWAVELSEFVLEFKPRPAIKAQVLADFLVEMTTNEAECSIKTWVVHVDGSSTSHGSGSGVLLESPQGYKLMYSIKCKLPTSNNEAEYKALVAGIKLALSAGARSLVVHSDSQLVLNQLNGTYEAKEEKMNQYVTQVNELLALLESYEKKQVPRENNEVADRLAKIASSWTNIDNRTITFLTISKEEAEKLGCNIFCVDGEEPSWKEEIVNYLMRDDLPRDPGAAHKLRIRAARFTVIEGELYKRCYSQWGISGVDLAKITPISITNPRHCYNHLKAPYPLSSGE
ncbi:uncharacterized protein [Primulina eburnea]|uniref:uncharacterized protein n=1 Tax=Primulina eburnea TaxID=1245227 RepID=UPI003C6C5CD5